MDEKHPGWEGGGMHLRHGWDIRMLMVLAALGWLAPIFSYAAGEGDGLPRIGPAPELSLTTQDGQRLSLKELRGKVVAVTFIYASCVDTCPLLTAKMAGLQAALGVDFGPKVFFLSITVDPERDTPAVLQRYAQSHGRSLPAGRSSRGRQRRSGRWPVATGSTTRRHPAGTWIIPS